MENLSERKQGILKLALIVGATILAIVIVVLINPFGKKSTDTTTTTDSTTTSKEKELTLSLSEKDKDRLNNTFTGTITQELLEDLKDVMLKEGVSPSEGNVSVEVDIFMTDLSWIAYPPYTTYMLSLSTSNGRQYDVYIANKENICYGVAIRQLKPTKDQPYLYVVNSTAKLDKYNSMVADLINWGKKLYPDGIIVNTHY